MSAGDDNRDSCGEAMFGSVNVKASANEFNFPGWEEDGRFGGICGSGRVHLGLRCDFRCIKERFNFPDEVGAKSVI